VPVIMQTNIGKVDDVIIAGEFKKRLGRLMWTDDSWVKSELAASGRRIVSQLAIPTQARA
jgi:5-methylthioadenosine/S-adenosylhomocysteine deaminase